MGDRPPVDERVPVAVVEDHPMYRRAVAEAVGAAPDLELVAACGSVEEFERHPGAGAARVVLLDLRLPGVDGAAGVGRVAGRGHAVLVLSGTALRDDVVDAFAAGARGYLTKSAEAEDVVAGVRALARGESYVEPGAAVHLVSAVRSGREPARPALSAREKEVLALVAAGRTDQEVARELFIGLTTVRSHLDSIRHKTGRRRRAELTRLALEEGLVDPAP